MSSLCYCVRQQAGPLTSPYERAEKNKLLRPPRDSSVCRNPVDRLELLLALFGYDGWSYVLTFDDEHLPPTFADVRRCWRSLLRRMRLYHGGPIDYVYLIEGRHGVHRYHMHLTVRYSDFPPVVMEDLWRFGFVEGAPLLCIGRDPYDTYRRTAKYLAGYVDEPHLVAAAWNLLWAIEMEIVHPECVDTPWRAADGE